MPLVKVNTTRLIQPSSTKKNNKKKKNSNNQPTNLVQVEGQPASPLYSKMKFLVF